MSDETPSSRKTSLESDAPSAPRVRRISNPRPKKAAKRAVIAEAPAAEEIPEIPAAAEISPPVFEAPEAPADTEWPEPEAATTGGAPSPSDPAKRKRRRRKGKGQGAAVQNGNPVGGDEAQSTPEVPQENPQENRQRPAPQQQQAPQQQAPRPKIDPEHLAKMAWKIYLAEVSEEGVALIGDIDAKDLSRRCFRLAEIFIEEQQRRR